jgi:hypothetical protein
VPSKVFHLIATSFSVILLTLFLIPGLILGIEKDPLESMDLSLLMAESLDTEGSNASAITGYLESRNQLKVKDIDTPVSLRQRLWLEYYPGQDLNFIRGFVSGYLDYDPAVLDWTEKRSELYFLQLNEAYLTVDTETFDFIFGKKMMRWGTGDGINPMDLINPRDHRDPIAGGRSDTRVPILLADGLLLMGSVTVEGVVIPKPEVNKSSLAGSPWETKGLQDLRRNASSGKIVLAPKEKPDDWLTDAEFALKISTVWKGFDLALLYYDGYTDDPAYSREYLTDGRMQFIPVYPRYQAYGFTFAKGFDRVTIRGELAAKKNLLFSIDPNDPAYTEDNDALVYRNLYQGVIGIDRTFYTNFYVNLQLFADCIAGGQEDLAAGRKSHGFTFEISDKFLDDDLQAGLRGTYFTSNNSSAVEIFSDYKIGDNWQIAPGCMVFSGSKDSRLGQFNENDMVYLKLRFSF